MIEGAPKTERSWAPLIAAVLVALAGAAVLVSTMRNRATEQLAQVTAAQARLTLATDDGGHLDVVHRDRDPDLYYRVTLSGAPHGARLPLVCDWLDPAEQIAHENRYETRPIDRDIWPTHCHYRIGSAAAVGEWKVRMRLNERVVSETAFTVGDSAGER